jgi:hypothetical protein
VIPDTAAGLLALLGCIAPGLVFQLRRERFTPNAEESVLRETARIALTSLIFTTAALGLVIWLSTRWKALPDVGEWLRRGGGYLPQNYVAVGGFLLLTVSLACAFALLLEWLTRSDIRGNLQPQSVWFVSFRDDRPSTTKRIRLWVTTTDGTEFQGALRHFTAGVALDNRELALGGSALRRRAPGADEATGWESLRDYDAILIPGPSIRHIAVSYRDADDRSLRATPPAPRVSWMSRLSSRSSAAAGRRNVSG